MQYAELICRTHYSFLRGASSPSEIIEQASILGLAAVAITDRNGVYGIPKAYRASQFQTSFRTQLIVGTELVLEEGFPIYLLAKNRNGYGNICQLITRAYEGRPKGEAALSIRDLLQMNLAQDMIALLRSELSGNYLELKDLFKENLYLSLSRVQDGRDFQRTQKALRLGQDLDIPIVATNDVYYHHQSRKPLQDVLTAIRLNRSIDELGFHLFSNPERNLKSPEQMADLFSDLPDALEQTIRIAEQCHFSPGELRYYYPSEWIPPGETSQTYLERLTWESAAKRYPQGIPLKIEKQIQHELNLIYELKFADYFLTIWEIIEFAKKKNILCQGRGSAANSAVCYCLGITAINPAEMDLLFERFISVERGEPPDIDVDFEHERREEVIQHIYQKYGRDRTGMVAALVTYRSRSALRDVKKALGLFATDEKISLLTEQIKGIPRHLSIHSGGFTLSAELLTRTVPIEPARMPGRTIVQWDKEDLDYIGLLKVDILALGMLTAIQKTFQLLSNQLDLARIPHQDSKTYQMIQRGETVGVFQIESRAQMGMLRRLLPNCFYDLVIEVAIVRPGPIQGQMVHPYLRRRRGQEDARSPDPRLDSILGRTLGVPLFQEQVMKIAMTLAHFTPGEADQLRRAIGAWRSNGAIEEMGQKLKQGLLANGLDPEFVERLFLQVRGFAEYGFPESHAASFALLAYASAYLKCHYPAEFTCALLNSQPMGFYAPHTLIEEAKRQGVQILPLDLNHSEWDCTIEEGKSLRIGWRMVKGLSRKLAEELIEARKERAFNGLHDFLRRANCPPLVLNRLAMAGTFQCFGLDQRSALWSILAFWKSSLPFQEERQMDLFPQLSVYEAIRAEYEALNLSVKGHPMSGLRRLGIGRLPFTTTLDLKKAKHGQRLRVAGMAIVRQRPPTAKGTVFATLEDEWGFADLIFHKDKYEEYDEVFEDTPFLIVIGKIQRDGLQINLIVEKVEPLLL